MEPNKFDKQIKQKLESRSALPKENTWNRLDTLLDADEKQTKNRKGFLYYGVAASIILFLSFFFFMNQEQGTNEYPQIVVETPLDTLQKNDRVLNEMVKEAVVEQSKIIDKTIKVIDQDVLEQIAVKQTNKKVIADKIELNNRLNSVKQHKKTFKEVARHRVENKRFATLIQENKDNDEDDIKLEKDVLLQNEVDDLLAIALTENEEQTPEKTTQQIAKDKSLDANANALLASVEQELDLTFKDKMLNKIKKGLQKTGTAVINRNK